MRGEDYSDFGSAVTGKIAGRFDFTDSFALRGDVSTGFRAPGLQQEFFTSTATNFINGVPFEVGTFPATSDVATTLGAQAARRGRSRATTRWAPCSASAASRPPVDAYRIDIRDRIVLSENLNTPQVAALIAPFGATVARFFINGVETRTEGIDVVARYVLAHGARSAASISSPPATGTTPKSKKCRRPTSSTTSASASRRPVHRRCCSRA